MRFKIFFPVLLALLFKQVHSQEIAIVHYKGGGDWYSNPTALPNLIAFCNQNINTKIKEKPAVVKADSEEIFKYPFLYMTGHGNLFFSKRDAENLRNYLLSGGFFHIDDNYGMEPYVQKEIVKIFPNKKWIALPVSHPIFTSPYLFKNGLPKIHEHDRKKPQALGIIVDNRLVLLFTYESDLGDGWENPEIHGDPEELRRQALKMGANIIQYAFRN